HSENCFAFASEPKAILSLPGIPSTLNKERVADFLTCVVADKESSFFKDILRLTPGYFIEVSNRKKRVCKYYELQPTMSGIKRSEEYQEQFKEVFTEAVQCRLRSSHPIGFYLSGGLDSSSIVCCASEIAKPEGDTPIQTFSGIFDEVKECDERKYFNHILEKYPIQPHYV
ncbi:MAG: asparagine synthetase B, partial [Bacteroidetes bacterium]|nr:asparagine synthetase B [Bacteroidota bacterium]